jgi:precorrin-2 methylase
MLYSTSLYLAQKLRELDITPIFIAGVPSYVACANIAAIPLGERRDSFVVQGMPDTAEELHELTLKFRTVVIMKISKRLPILLEYVKRYSPTVATIVKRATLEGEMIVDLTKSTDVEADAGYLAVAIIKL